MFGNSKPSASLSSGLLARKGQARPAMRPQGFVGMTPGQGQDDLGWNDMGDDVAPFHSPSPVPLTPAPVSSQQPPAVPAEKPPVLRQREVLDEKLAAPAPVAQPNPAPAPQPEPAPQPAPAAAPQAEAAPEPQISRRELARVEREVRRKRGKAAFTLRLDSDRHLRLRLASAVHGRSAQQLVTEALDAFLSTLPEVDELASRLEAPGRG